MYKKDIITDKSFLLKSMQIENSCIDDKHRIQKHIVEGSYIYSQQLENLFIMFPSECKFDFAITYSNNDFADPARTIDLQITLYDGIDDDIIQIVLERFEKYRSLT